MNLKNFFRGSFAGVLSVLFLLCGCTAQRNASNTASHVKESEMRSACMTVLGDSIASGHALSNPQKQRYSELLDQMLLAENIDCAVTNYAGNGMDSDELLSALKNQNYPQLVNADWVIVSIGANNLLGATMDFFYDHFSSLFSSFSELTDDDYTDFLNELEKGITQFQEELPLIIREVRAQNSDCRIILQTVYNPFRDTKLSLYAPELSVSLNELSMDYIERINQVIWQLESADDGILIADVLTAFAQSPKDCVNTQSGRKLFQLPIDPHPNQNGHRLIAELILPLLLR